MSAGRKLGSDDDRIGSSFGPGEAGTLLVEAISQDPLEADHVGDEQVAPEVLGEVAARQDLDPRARAGPLRVDLGRRRVLVRVGHPAREQGPVVRVRPRPVDDHVLAPAVEGVAVGVGEAVRDVDLELAACPARTDRPPRSSSGRAAHRRSRPGSGGTSLPGNRGPRRGRAGSCWRRGGCRRSRGRTGPGRKCRPCRRRRCPPGTSRIRGLGDVDPSRGELEPGRAVEAVGEDRLLVGLAVAVGVLEDQDLVVHLVAGLPVRVARPAGDPEPTPGVERHLHRLGQLGESLLGGEQVHLQPLPRRSSGRWPPRRRGRRVRRPDPRRACWSSPGSTGGVS